MAAPINPLFLGQCSRFTYTPWGPTQYSPVLRRCGKQARKDVQHMGIQKLGKWKGLGFQADCPLSHPACSCQLPQTWPCLPPPRQESAESLPIM